MRIGRRLGQNREADKVKVATEGRASQLGSDDARSPIAAKTLNGVVLALPARGQESFFTLGGQHEGATGEAVLDGLCIRPQAGKGQLPVAKAEIIRQFRCVEKEKMIKMLVQVAEDFGVFFREKV